MHLGCSVPCFSQLIKEFVCPWLFTNWDHQLWFVYVNYDLSQTQQKLHSVPTALGVRWAWISARKPCCTPWTNHHPNLKMAITRRYGMIWRYKSSSFRVNQVPHGSPQPSTAIFCLTPRNKKHSISNQLDAQRYLGQIFRDSRTWKLTAEHGRNIRDL